LQNYFVKKTQRKALFGENAVQGAEIKKKSQKSLEHG
jgi:hypothetical protein